MWKRYLGRRIQHICWTCDHSSDVHRTVAPVLPPRASNFDRVRVLAYRMSCLGCPISPSAPSVSSVRSRLALWIMPFRSTALAISSTPKGPVLFRQSRVGRHGATFSMWKFRSMHVNADALHTHIQGVPQSRHGIRFKDKRDPRVTLVGRFIRKASIDALPQLWNVLIGDMSLVGPRPALPSEVCNYSLSDRDRLLVKPGITCTWQVWTRGHRFCRSSQVGPRICPQQFGAGRSLALAANDPRGDQRPRRLLIHSRGAHPMSTELDFLVLADRSVKAIAPIMDDTPIATTPPIAGKAIIDHVVETHRHTRTGADFGLRSILNDKQKIPAHVTRQSWTKAAITVEHAAPRRTKRRTLVLRGDTLPSPAILSRALDEIGSTGNLTHDLSMDGIWLLPESLRCSVLGRYAAVRASRRNVFTRYRRLPSVCSPRGARGIHRPSTW